MSQVGHFAHTHAQEAIEGCLAAYKACLETAAYCINKAAVEGGDWAEPHRIQILYDAADVSLAMAGFLTRASRHHHALAAVCVEVNEACAERLEGEEHDDPQLRATYAALQQSLRPLRFLLERREPAEEDARDEALRETFPASDPPPPPTEL